MRKRIISMLMAVVLALSWMQADVFAAGPTYNVRIHTTASSVEFKNSANGTVETTKSSENGYTVYLLKAESGTYTYSASGYGTGTIKIGGDADIFLRAVNYTFSAGGSAFQMIVSNTNDTELVYASPISTGKSVSLLVPALGWSTTYRYQFAPQDEAYCPFYGELWVLPGTTELAGFKSTNYNLSDSGKYVMGKKTAMEFHVPAGSKLGVYSLVKFYCPPVQYQTKFVKTENGSDVYSVYVADPGGGNYYYTVSKPGSVTTSRVFTTSASVITVNESDISGGPNQQLDQSWEASLISNGNASKFIRLNSGEEFAIWTSRAWQAIDSITGNRYVEPDKHYYVLSGDSVTVDDIGTVRAVKDGLSIVAVTYDAMKYEGDLYSAVKSDSIGVFAFMVGGNSEGLSTGLSMLSDLDTFYYAKTVKVDGASQTDSGSFASYTFKPSVTDNSEISVSVCTAYGYPSPTLSAWQNYTKNPDGAFTIRLYEGRNIVRVRAGDKTACHVVNCKGSDVTISNISAPGSAPKADESVKISFTNIITPLPKLGAIYNPGFGGTVYLTGTLTNGDSGKSSSVSSTGVQYNLSTSAALLASLSEAGNYSLAGTRIHTGAFGAAPDSHYALSRQSDGGSYAGGDTPQTEGMFSYLPEVSFKVESADHAATAASIVALIDNIGSVTYDETCHARISQARSAYDSASSAVRALITEAQLKTLTDAEQEYTRLDEADIGAKLEKRTIDGKEYYVLSNAAQLNYFAKLVNGTLSDAAQNSAANALLECDITVNEAVLGENNSLMTASASEWTPMGSASSPYTGIFDGDGHTINGVYINTSSKTTVGFFGVSSGTIRNLSLSDCYIGTSVHLNDSLLAAGVCAKNSGVIDKVTFNGYVGAENCVGGIVSDNSGTISGCVFAGKAEATGTVTGLVAGIACTTGGLVSHCVSTGVILSQNGSESAEAGGIVYGASGASAAVEYCYSSAAVTGRIHAGGIAVTAGSSSKISACYFAGKVTANTTPGGGILAVVGSSGVLGLPSYYLSGSAFADTEVAGKIIVKSPAQFSGGEVACLLGSEYGQTLGTDDFPVFNNGSNQVFKLSDAYVNASAATAIRMIDAIGTVAADGSNNCFSNLAAAQDCYNMLSEIEKADVTNAALLVQKQSDYDSAVNGLIAQIDALAGTADKGAVEAAKNAFLGYVVRGGSSSKITNTSKIAAAMLAYYTAVEDSTAAGMAKRTIDGKEYYVLSSAEELMWFAKAVNGKLASGSPAQPGANAILANDISVNDKFLSSILDQSGNIIDDIASIETPWSTIGTYTGIFDGNGHTVNGIYYNNDVSSFAMFGTVGGSIVNLSVSDSYINAANAAGIAQTVNSSGTLDGCAFEGVIKGKMKAGGIALSVYGNAFNCYSIGTMSLSTAMENSSIMGGIVADVANTSLIKNCFSASSFSGGWGIGGIAGTIPSVNTKIIENCWYLDSSAGKGVGKDSSTVSMGISTYTDGQLKNGELAYRLGSAFGQKIGVDEHPVLSNGSNTVYYAGGIYTNGSVDTAVSLIAEIGKVGLDGGENCFGRAVAAKSCFDGLTESEKAKVGNAASLTEALSAYDAVVSGLQADIDAIYPLNKDDRDTKYQAVCEKITAYSSRGGDISKITNYTLLQKAADELKPLLLLWTQEDVEARIQTRTVDGKEFYVITDADSLLWFAGLVNGTLQTNTPKNPGANAVLDADIALNRNLKATILDESGSLNEKMMSGVAVWTPITAFSGVFDGAGHSVSGIFYSSSSTGFGMFNTVSGTVKDLNVQDSVLYGTSTSSSGTGTGGIAGVLSAGGKISGCSFSGLVQGTVSIGGLVGINNGEITLCRVSDTKVVSTAKTMLIYTGGLAGNNKGDILNCYMSGTVKNTANYAAAQYIGGIAGYNNASCKITNCYNTASVSGLTKSIGAIVGINKGDVQNCYYLTGTAPTGIGATSAAGTPDVSDVTEVKSSTAFADGSVAAALGEAYTQRAGIDDFPVFFKDVPAIEVSGAPGRDVLLNESVKLKAVLAKSSDTAEYQWYASSTNSNQSGTAVTGASAASFQPDTSAAGTVYYYCVSGGHASKPICINVIQTYTLTVINGTDMTGSGPYPAGTKLQIQANDPGDYKTFSGWQCNQPGSVFADALKLNTEFTMPAANTVITANYQAVPEGNKISVYFTLLGDSIHEESSTDVHTLKDNNLETWIPKTKVVVDKGAKVGDAFKKALDANHYTYVGFDTNYISSITTPERITLEQFTNGPKSGWMYTLNGTHPLYGLLEQSVSDGDVIVWHYTDDYTLEEGSEKWNNGSDQGSGVSGNTSIKPEATVQDGKAAVAVTLDDIKDAIVSAKEKGGAIIIAPEMKGKTASAMTVSLNKDALTAIAGQTSADLSINTALGNITFPNSALSSIASQITGNAVSINLSVVDAKALTADQQKAVGSNTVYDISILSGSTAISSFDSSSITISLPYTLKSGESASGVTVWYLNDAGKLERMTGSYDKTTGLASFTTTHLSKYVVGYGNWSNPFADVKEGAWYYDAVQYAVSNGLFQGYSDTTFAPDDAMTRAMLVTVLYRMEKSPAVTGASTFTDVKAGQWYTDAVLWAQQNKLVTGYDDATFGPDDPVNREQMATILYRYAQSKKYDVSVGKDTNLLSYTDAMSVSEYAMPAMQWACGARLINGSDGKLMPRGDAQRAQVAAILMRFAQNVVK